MTDCQVPDRAASWIVSHLRSEKIDVADYREESIRSASGLAALTVKELKLIANHLELLRCRDDPSATSCLSVRFHKPPSKAKKEKWIKSIQKCFYVDDSCIISVKDDDAIWGLIESTTGACGTSGSGNIGSEGVQNSGAQTQHSASNRFASRSPGKNGSHVMGETTANNRAYPPTAPKPSSRKRRYPDGFGNLNKKSKPNGTHDCANGSTGPPNGTYKSALAKIAADQVKVKMEKRDHEYARMLSGNNGVTESLLSQNAERFETRPKDLCESTYVSQLRGMGFTDMREMLSGIRHVQGMGSCNVIEDAMMWIVTQREEVEEARKLDRARISSEFALTEEQQREKDIDKQLRKSSLDAILDRRSEFFPSSILLQCAEVMSIFHQIIEKEGKALVIRYLTLEKRAIKWYGTVVPWAYFYYVAKEHIISLVKDGDKKNVGRDRKLSPSEVPSSKLGSAVDELETALYSLSEQQEVGVGKVPKIFLAARRDASNKGLPQSPENSLATGESDDEVVVVEEPGDKVSSTTTSVAKGEREYHIPQPTESKTSKKDNIEIIEIE